MRIGMDIDMQTNIGEGYTILEYKKRELLPKGKLNFDAHVRIIEHFPDHIRQEMDGGYPVGAPRIDKDIYVQVSDIWKMYQREKKQIDSFIGSEFKNLDNEYSVLHLANSLLSYFGEIY